MTSDGRRFAWDVYPRRLRLLVPLLMVFQVVALVATRDQADGGVAVLRGLGTLGSLAGGALVVWWAQRSLREGGRPSAPMALGALVLTTVGLVIPWLITFGRSGHRVGLLLDGGLALLPEFAALLALAVSMWIWGPDQPVAGRAWTDAGDWRAAARDTRRSTLIFIVPHVLAYAATVSFVGGDLKWVRLAGALSSVAAALMLLAWAGRTLRLDRPLLGLALPAAVFAGLGLGLELVVALERVGRFDPQVESLTAFLFLLFAGIALWYSRLGSRATIPERPSVSGGDAWT